MEIAGVAKNLWPRLLVRRGLSRTVNIWTIATIAAVLAVSSPLFVILVRLFDGSNEVWRHISATLLPGYIINSIILIAGTSVLTLVLGVSTAWLVTLYKFPGHRMFEWLLILPLALPTYIVAYTYAGMLDYTAPLQVFIRTTFGQQAGLSIDIMTMPGVIFVISFVLYPYVYVITRASFLQQSHTVFEAARILGKTPMQTFVKVALPLARPAIVGGLLLVMMETLNDYGAVKYFGISTFTTGIFRAWFSMGDAASAIRLCAFLMVMVFILIALERMQRGRAKFENAANGYRPLNRRKLSKGKSLAAFTACLIPVCFGFLLPLAQLGHWCWQTAGSMLDQDFATLMLNSLALATTAALLTVFVALVIVYAVRLNRGPALRGFTKIAILGYSVPGAVIAVGVMLPFAWIDSGIDSFLTKHFNISTGLLFSGTLLAVTFAYLVRFLALAVNPLESGFEKSCEQLDDASRSLGIRPLKTLLRINLPLVRGALLGALILVFVDVLKELPLTLILRPFNFDTLATRAFELASDEMVAESASAALVIVAIGTLPIVLVNRLLVKGRSWQS